MNNRLKFRVWFAPDWQEPEMIYEAEHTYDNRCRNKGSFHHESFGEILEDKDCIVMQSTGLKDKNGKLIFEGDIVKEYYYNTKETAIKKIIFDENICGYVYTDGIEYNSLCFSDCRRLEVIGNIYENKDLLNENE